MTRALAVPVAAYLAVCAAMFACSENAVVPGIDTNDVEEAEDKVGSLLSQLDAGSAAAASSMSSGGTTAPPADTSKKNPNLCTYDEPNKRFVCPSRTDPMGMKHDMSFQLLDAANQPQQHFDTATTVAIRRITDRSGTMNQPLMTQNGPVPATQTIAAHEEMTLSGFKTKTPEHNGTGTMTNKMVPEGMPSADISSTQTFTKMKFPPPPPPPAPGTSPAPPGPMWPTSGTITAVITSKTGTQPTVTTTQVTTYDGTPIAKTVITLPNGTTRTCSYDMSAKSPGLPNCTTP